MRLQFKNNFWGYFKFYYSVLGNRILINFLLCIMVSFIDGMGLAMFMPLLSAVDQEKTNSKESLGQLHFFTDVIENMGFSLNVTTVLATLILVFVIKGVLKYSQMNYQVGIRHLFMKRVRYKLVEDMQALSYQGFLKFDSGTIQNTLIAEVQRLFMTLNFYFTAAQTAVMLVTYIVLAFLANYQFAMLVAIGAGLTNFLYRKIYLLTKKVSRDLSKKGHDFNGLLIQAIHNFKYLRATNYFYKFQFKLKDVIDHTEALNKRMGRYSAVTTSLKEPMIVIVVTIVIYFQLTVMHASLSSILVSLLLFYRALSFLVAVQNHWQSFVQNIGAIHTVTEFTHKVEAMKESETGNIFTSIKSNIQLSDISFSYGSNKILDKINLDIPKNQTIAFIGESGSGKTTLANIISSLIQVQSGNVYIDNVELCKYNLATYREKIGYISQEAVIFTDDIYNNVTFWAERSEENVKRFWEVIEMAALTEFIKAQPLQENTKLGDNGVLVSGGQKQRISIARELYKKAEILILDEATSALDSETEKVIQKNIEQLHGQYTIIIIAHRLSTIKNVDVIYLLEKGKVAASGRFNEILEQSSKFRRMVELQEF